MSTETASLFFAILSLIALTGTVALIGLHVASRGRPDGQAALLVTDIGRVALPLAWLVATVTTLGSLFFSEVAHFTPCTLCWYQRIAIYPLVLLLGIATFRRDAAVKPYVIAQCGVGLVISTYHTWIQAFPPEGGSSFCTKEAPCTARYVWELGFVSLPFMALTAFAAIIALLSTLPPATGAGQPPPDDAAVTTGSRTDRQSNHRAEVTR